MWQKLQGSRHGGEIVSLFEKYELICGLETHIELLTKSKIFCSCATSFGDIPNTHVCPICLGHPGVLPRLNGKVLDFAIMAGIATNCEVEKTIGFDRKNYFYCDLPKGYQITQNKFPICKGGYIELEKGKKIRINHIHIEEDAAKLTYKGQDILIDYNRSGVPLIEVVSEPDLNDLLEIKEYLSKLQHLMRYIGVSDCKMQEGSMRCDVNISVRKVGEKELNMKTEVKNVNSISHILKTVEYEFKRQAEMLEKGEVVSKETRRYNELAKKTEVMRKKEEQREYKYFKEPDIPLINISEEKVNSIRKLMPEMPQKKIAKFTNEYGLSALQAKTLIKYRKVADCFEAVCDGVENKKIVANFFINEIFESLDTEAKKQDFLLPVKVESLNKLMKLLDSGKITVSFAKEIFETMVQNNENVNVQLDESKIENFDEGKIKEICMLAIKENQKAVDDYKSGKKNAINILIKDAMTKSNRAANGKLILDTLKNLIK